jgi:hypothetical protein
MTDKPVDTRETLDDAQPSEVEVANEPSFEDRVTRAFSEVAKDVQELKAVTIRLIYRESVLSERMDDVISTLKELKNERS